MMLIKMHDTYTVRAAAYYTSADTWMRVTAEGQVRVGVTDFAQKQLKSIVFVDLPEIGSQVRQMEPFGSVESIKAVSDLCCPVSGIVEESNNKVIDSPSIINKAPYDTGWLMLVRPTNLENETKNLLDAVAYRRLIDARSRKT